jgi:hypothetical protein
MAYISGPAGVVNDLTTPNSTTGDTTPRRGIYVVFVGLAIGRPRLRRTPHPPMFLWANHQTPRARPGLPPSLLTRPPQCTGSIVHDFVLFVSPPCGPHLVPPSTGSLEPSLFVSLSPGGPSRLKTFCARFSPTTTRTRLQPTTAQ